MDRRSLDTLESELVDRLAEHVAVQVPVASPASTAHDIRRSLEGHRFETVPGIAICEDERFVGLLSLEDMLAAPGDTAARELMDATPPTVAPGTDREVAAWTAVQHGESTLAVVDEAGGLVGLIPPHRLLGVLLEEHEEDMARLGGLLSGTATARRASEESVWARFRHRLPWLLLGLVGALIAADIVGRFEGALEENLILAFFIPGIVYMADAVGTQTETVVIRGLSVGIPIPRVMRRELLAGVMVGATISMVFFPIALLRWGDPGVALAVGLALLAACSTATLVAMLLPWVFQRLGKDPAFGSGPMATVIQDLLSIVIYLAIAIAIVG